MTPLVSIIIPCFNAEAWLAETIDSALAQSWPEKEILVINDGSTDGSLRVAQSFVARGVQVHDQPNQGASAARNHGLRLARGAFIQFLDADDLLAPDKITLQMQALTKAEPDMLAAGSWGRFASDVSDAQFVPQAVAQAGNGVEFLQLHFETGSMMQPGAWLAPRQLLNRAGPWDEAISLNDDGEYFARVMLAARGLLHVPESRCFYRSGLSASLSRRTDPIALGSLFRSVQKILENLQAADQSPRTRSACAQAWMRVAFEVYPTMPDLSSQAETFARNLGGSPRPMPGSGRFQLAARFLGWRIARRLFP